MSTRPATGPIASRCSAMRSARRSREGLPRAVAAGCGTIGRSPYSGCKRPSCHSPAATNRTVRQNRNNVRNPRQPTRRNKPVSRSRENLRNNNCPRTAGHFDQPPCSRPLHSLGASSTHRRRRFQPRALRRVVRGTVAAQVEPREKVSVCSSLPPTVPRESAEPRSWVPVRGPSGRLHDRAIRRPPTGTTNLAQLPPNRAHGSAKMLGQGP